MSDEEIVAQWTKMQSVLPVPEESSHQTTGLRKLQ